MVEKIRVCTISYYKKYRGGGLSELVISEPQQMYQKTQVFLTLHCHSQCVILRPPHSSKMVQQPQASHLHTLCQFPRVVVTKYLKLGGLRQQKSIVSQFQRPEVRK